MSNSSDTIFNLVGGDDFFLKLVDIFYTKVAQDEVLNHMFHEGFEQPKHNLYLFLRKIFGGPDDYTPARGHPKMRRRHFPFAIGMVERNRWIKLMLESLDELKVSKEHPAREPMESYFQNVATHMINQKVTLDDINSAGIDKL